MQRMQRQGKKKKKVFELHRLLRDSSWLFMMGIAHGSVRVGTVSGVRNKILPHAKQTFSPLIGITNQSNSQRWKWGQPKWRCSSKG